MKKQIYKWHRILGLIVALPVAFWILSGLLHPVMGWIKPALAKRQYIAESVNLSTLEHSIANVLDSLNIKSVENVNVISLDSVRYYQIKQSNHVRHIYVNTETAKLSDNFENQYIEHLARYYSGDKTSEIKSIDLVTSFSAEYKQINRLLPIYKVAFDRADGYTIFVDVESGRLGGVLDNNRLYFNIFFEIFHNLSFLASAPSLQLWIILLLSLATLISGISGIYIYGFTKKSLGERAKLSNDKRTVRNYHRFFGFGFSIALLLFSFSGAYHAFKKSDGYNRLDFVHKDSFSVGELRDLEFPKETVNELSLVRMNSTVYVQTFNQIRRKQSIRYFSNGEELIGGDEAYAKQLALEFSNFSSKQISSVNLQKKFSREYGFINKRLPVYKIQFNVDENERYYVETRSGKLGAKVKDSDIYEGLSFAYLHKYHMFDFLGKDLRNIIMMCFALGNLVAIIFGLRIAFQKKRKRQITKDEPVLEATE